MSVLGYAVIRGDVFTWWGAPDNYFEQSPPILTRQQAEDGLADVKVKFHNPPGYKIVEIREVEL